MYFFNIKYNIIKAALTVFFLGGGHLNVHEKTPI